MSWSHLLALHPPSQSVSVTQSVHPRLESGAAQSESLASHHHQNTTSHYHGLKPYSEVRWGEEGCHYNLISLSPRPLSQCTILAIAGGGEGEVGGDGMMVSDGSGHSRGSLTSPARHKLMTFILLWWHSLSLSSLSSFSSLLSHPVPLLHYWLH